MASKKEKNRRYAQIASATRGRLRIKLHPSSRNAKAMGGIKDGLDGREGIHDVRLNPSTGSITVRYDQDRHTTDSILGLLRDVDVMIQSVGHVPILGEPTRKDSEGRDSVGFLEAITDINQRILDRTGVPVDMKTLLPLAFAGAGIWSIARKGLMIESVPGWLFLWFAFDMFVKMHPAPR
jgi:hypothetical protein